MKDLIPMASPEKKRLELSFAMPQGGCCYNECSKAAAGSRAVDYGNRVHHEQWDREGDGFRGATVRQGHAYAGIQIVHFD